jgi:hypothetical protein
MALGFLHSSDRSWSPWPTRAESRRQFKAARKRPP